MHDRLQALSGREVEVLRLLLAGHDAKSVARLLSLSVHTVNDRLRNARRKLGVSSSREAARLLAQKEQQRHDFFAPERFGVPAPLLQQHPRERETSGRVRPSFAWIAGGMLLMSLTTAALLFATGWGGDDQAELAPTSASPDTAMLLGPIDLMPIADTNRDGQVSTEEYRAFSEQGWGFAAQGRNEVRLGELDPLSRTAFVGITPDSDGVITRQAYIDAIPERFGMLDQNGDGVLSADELNGRAFQGPAPPLR